MSCGAIVMLYITSFFISLRAAIPVAVCAGACCVRDGKEKRKTADTNVPAVLAFHRAVWKGQIRVKKVDGNSPYPEVDRQNV